ncbi:MAG: hypothetical protein ABI488_02955, partial [Polyangiaceae bacterium]
MRLRLRFFSPLVLLGVLGCRSTPAPAPAPLAPPSAEVAAPRSPALIRQQGNHLVGSASAYLREHAHNPV